MNIIKDDNWYTIYSKDGVYIKCVQDREVAEGLAKEFNCRYTITSHYVEKPVFELANFTLNNFLKACGSYITVISLLLLLISLLTLPFNFEYWMYHLLAFVIFFITMFLGMRLSSKYTVYYD